GKSLAAGLAILTAVSLVPFLGPAAGGVALLLGLGPLPERARPALLYGGQTLRLPTTSLARAVVAERLVALLRRAGEPLLARRLQKLVHALLVRAERAELRSDADAGVEPHDLHLPVYDAFIELDEVGRHRSDALRHVEHLRLELIGRHRRVCPAELRRLDSGERIAREHHLHRLAHADEPGVEVVVGHAEAHRRVSHLCVVGHVDEVTAGGELAAARKAVAVHLRDHGLAELPDAHPACRHVARPVAVTARRIPGQLLSRVAAAELVAGREARARAAHDHHAHRGIGVGGL